MNENQALQDALRKAVENLWELKNGLMDLRESPALLPTREEWIAAKMAELLPEAALAQPSAAKDAENKEKA